MDGSLLLAGTTSPILDSFARSAALDRIVIATDRMVNDEGEREQTIRWNRRSPIAARTLVLHTLTSLRSIDHAVLVLSVDRSALPFHEQGAAFFEQRIDEELKGYLFLCRELLLHFSKIGSGSIDFILHDPSQHVVDPVAAAAAAAFKSMAQSLFVLYQNEPVRLRGFSSESDRVDEYADYVWTTIEEKGDKSLGRWNRFGGRNGLFSFSRGSR